MMLKTSPTHHSALALALLTLGACTGLKDSQEVGQEVCTAPVQAIHEVQGPGVASPLAGEQVTVRGVVVGDFRPRDQLSGFFLQDLRLDDDPRTSEGLFIYAPSEEVTVGDLVQVSGRVKEYDGLTELTGVDEVTVCRSGTPPEPTSISLTRVDDLEPYEGMLVTLADDLAVAGSHDLALRGQLLLAAGGRPYKQSHGEMPRRAKGRRLLLDDGSRFENPETVPFLDDHGTRRVGDTLSGVIGVISEQDGSHVLHPTIQPRFSNANPRTAEPPPVGGSVRVVGFNLLNFFTTFNVRGAENDDQLELQRTKHVTALTALDADIVGLSELENNGEVAIRDLVDALNSSAEPGKDDWAHVGDPADGLGEDVIRVGIIYRATNVRPVGPPIVDRDPVFKRPPFAQTFEADGERFTVVVNHFKSKSCRKATGAEGDAGDGQGCWNPQRVRQARRLLEFVAQLQTESGDPDVLVTGDLNAYGAEDPIRALTDGGLIDLAAAHVPAAERYSYVYSGETGYLDHALATPDLASRVTGTAFWHINADEPSFLEYKNSKHCRPDPFRSSDHDPVLIGLDF